jgi:histidyl-tRNA synthetase
MTEKKLVEPELLKGFRDLMPAQMIGRRKVVEVIRQTYELYGFVPLETPALEKIETLLGSGEEADKLVFQFSDQDEQRVGLRYDLTAPLARVVAQYRELPKPFKRYQISPVWRYDKPGPGRFREFLQFDIDTVGSPSMEADAEIIAAMSDALMALGIQRYGIRFSNRKILNCLIAFADIPAELTLKVFRVIDKFDRIGIEGIREELTKGRVDVSGDKIPGVGLALEKVTPIEKFLSLPKGSRTGTIEAVTQLFAGVPGADEGIGELKKISACLEALGVPEEKAYIDLTIARGLDYYTGPVYEAWLLDAREFGSIMGGGRYDGLVERFIPEKIPATGASIGVDRLFAALQKLELIETVSSTAQVLVTVMDRERSDEYQRIARELRTAGIRTELYLGTEKGLRKQLEYCDRQGIPVSVIAGSNEFQANQVTIKDMRKMLVEGPKTADRKEWLAARTGQKTIVRADMVSEILALL